jgi:hypothetical protein
MTVWLGPGTVHDEPICKKAKPKHNKYPIGVDNMDMNLIIVILSPVRALVANIRPDNIKALDPKLYPAPVAKVFNEITKTVKANKADFKPATGYIVYPSKDAEGEVPGCGNDVLIDCQKRLMGLKVPPPVFRRHYTANDIATKGDKGFKGRLYVDGLGGAPGLYLFGKKRTLASTCMRRSDARNYTFWRR